MDCKERRVEGIGEMILGWDFGMVEGEGKRMVEG